MSKVQTSINMLILGDALDEPQRIPVAYLENASSEGFFYCIKRIEDYLKTLAPDHVLYGEYDQSRMAVEAEALAKEAGGSHYTRMQRIYTVKPEYIAAKFTSPRLEKMGDEYVLTAEFIPYGPEKDHILSAVGNGSKTTTFGLRTKTKVVNQGSAGIVKLTSIIAIDVEVVDIDPIHCLMESK